jgi:hypothetical protein
VFSTFMVVTAVGVVLVVLYDLAERWWRG